MDFWHGWYGLWDDPCGRCNTSDTIRFKYDHLASSWKSPSAIIGRMAIRIRSLQTIPRMDAEKKHDTRRIQAHFLVGIRTPYDGTLRRSCLLSPLVIFYCQRKNPKRIPATNVHSLRNGWHAGRRGLVDGQERTRRRSETRKVGDQSQTRQASNAPHHGIRNLRRPLLDRMGHIRSRPRRQRPQETNFQNEPGRPHTRLPSASRIHRPDWPHGRHGRQRCPRGGERCGTGLQHLAENGRPLDPPRGLRREQDPRSENYGRHGDRAVQPQDPRDDNRRDRARDSGVGQAECDDPAGSEWDLCGGIGGNRTNDARNLYSP
mmetsp:Transcript_18274/g.26235  ORF Transcript_18274/g.26235 Transcript_18274/m.26235 type:complete len:318 (-) Transcript_18274:167-1120(-)